MAKYTVTRSCGHEETVVLFGPGKQRDWRLESVEPYKLCSECYQAELKRKREETNREAAEAAKESGLPALTGTEKQVAWAETLRMQMLALIDEAIYTHIKADQRGDIRLLDAVESIKAKTDARWWIENRQELSARDMIALIAKEMQAQKIEAIAAPKEVVVDALVEATIRPEKPVTETVAEIRVGENSVEIVFPEKLDDFREIVKKQLHMKWEGKWERKLISRNGTQEDRAAEAGYRLLAAGFPIRIFDAEIREKAIHASYEPECTRWILARSGKEYDGWLAIVWDREDDFYKAARRLPGSRYSSPSVVVRPEHYEEVLDFAGRYGFKVSANAQSLINAAKEIRERALIPHIDAPEEAEHVSISRVPPVLEVPVEVGIDDEFKD